MTMSNTKTTRVTRAPRAAASDIMMVANRDAHPIPIKPKTTAMKPMAAPMGWRMRPYDRLLRTPGRLLTLLFPSPLANATHREGLRGQGGDSRVGTGNS